MEPEEQFLEHTLLVADTRIYGFYYYSQQSRVFKTIVLVLNFTLDECEQLFVMIVTLSDWRIRLFQVFVAFLG